MSTSVTIAAVQMNSSDDKEANLRRAGELAEQAADRGAKFVALPEMFNCLGPLKTVVENAETIPGPTSRKMSELAQQLKLILLAGSICERSDVEGKGFNTSTLFSETEKLV